MKGETMRFTALACDYDGTLASHDRMAAPTTRALEQARAAGLRLLLVTGRAFFELLRVCDRLDLFDAVVAENGGVLYFPAEGRISDMALEPSSRLLAELDRRGVPYHAGRVVIGTTRDYEGEVRAALAATGVTLAMVANRASLMLLPHGVDKGTSVRHVIRMLGLSPRDILALGDAENDVALFEACGFSACPGDATEELKARADWVFPGRNGGALASAIDRIAGGHLSLPARPRHRISIGWTAPTATPVVIPGRDANILVGGDTHAGKSWLAGALVESLAIERYATCVIDPEGDYHVLAALPSVAWFSVAREGDWSDVLGVVRHDPAATVVADVSTVNQADKVRLIGAGLQRIRALRAARGFPHWVVLDEAHYWLHPEGGLPADSFRLDEKGFCFVTHRPSWLRPAVIDSIDVVILARATDPEELTFLRALVGRSAVAAAPGLPAREFLLAERGAPPMTFVAPPRLTRHVRHLHKYADRPVAPHHRFAFQLPGEAPVAVAATLGEFAGAIARVGAAILDHHAAHGDFSRWILDVFGDRHLGGRLRKVERRWASGEIGNLRDALVQTLGAVAADRVPGQGLG
jgi:hydroxymethylpyrimidine pyrophosphatase-like HAD family hydrolase